MSQTSLLGGEASADAVAADLDRIAQESIVSGATPSGTPTTTETVTPNGPVLSVSEWVARTLKLIDSLKKPDDTKPAEVARVLNMTLVENESAYRATGALVGGGNYAIWSNALYREYPDKWTVGLSQHPHEGKADCLFPLDALRAHVLRRGYKATEGLIRRDGSESALYRSPASSEGVVFVVEAQIRRMAGEPACIQKIEIDANTREEGA